MPPSVVRGSDLVSAVWPPGSTLRRPQLGAAAQMAPAGAALNFCLMPGGAAQWCAVASMSFKSVKQGLRGHTGYQLLLKEDGS